MEDERVCVGSGFGRKFSSCSGSAAASEASGAVHVGAAGTVPADSIAAGCTARLEPQLCCFQPHCHATATPSLAGGAAQPRAEGCEAILRCKRRTEAVAAALDLDIITGLYIKTGISK